jgi:hypothetical protein
MDTKHMVCWPKPSPLCDTMQSCKFMLSTCEYWVLVKVPRAETHRIVNHSSGGTTSRYESNYIKIAMVVLRVSPRAVRVQFDKEFHPNYLKRTLKNELSCLTAIYRFWLTASFYYISNAILYSFVFPFISSLCVHHRRPTWYVNNIFFALNLISTFLLTNTTA